MPKKEYKYIRKTFTFDGKRYEVRGKTEAEAFKMGALKRAALERGEVIKSNGLTVKAWCEEWLSVYVEPKISKDGKKTKESITQKSYDMYEQKIRLYIVPAIGRMRLADVTSIHLQKLMGAQAGKSKSHAKKLLMTVKKVFRRARIDGLILKDPSEALELPAVTEGKRRSLTPEEQKLFLTVCETYKHRIWALTLYYMGIRPSESPALTKNDVDIKAKVLRINKGVESGTTNIAEPKSEAGKRIAPIPDVFLPEIAEYIKDLLPDDRLFCKEDGSILTNSCMSSRWKSLLRKMDILAGAEVDKKSHKIIKSVLADDLVLDDLRHTYCTNLQKKGVPLNIAKYLMGHSDVKVTANIYTHSSDADVATASVLINSKRGKKRGKYHIKSRKRAI